MGVAQAALIVGAVLWAVGLRTLPRGTLQGSRRKVEYWWAAAATSAGIVGGLLSFAAFTASPVQSTIVRAAPLALLGLLLLARYWPEGLVVPGAGTGLILFFGILLAFVARDAPMSALVSLLLYIPAILVPKHGYDFAALRRGSQTGITIALVVLLCLSVAMPTAMFGDCRADKCSVWGMALGGTRGNALGLALAAAGVISMLSIRSLTSLALVAAGSYLLVDLTASRSAMYGWYVGCAIVVAYFLTVWRHRRSFVGVAAMTVSAVVAIVPFLDWRGEELTGRTMLWRRAEDLFLMRPLFGYGSSFWVNGASSSEIYTNYSTHNLATELLVSSGLVGTLAFLFALILAARGRGEFDPSAYTIALVAATMGLSIAEVLAAPGRIYLADGVMVLFFLTSQASESVREGRDPPPLKGMPRPARPLVTRR